MSYVIKPLQPGSVTATEIATDAVGAAEIAAGAVGSSEIATDAVTAAEIAAGAVGNGELAADSVDAAKIAAGAVGSSEIANYSVGALQLAAGAVTEGKVANNAITAAKMADNAIGTLEIIDGAVSKPKLAAGVVGEADFVSTQQTMALATLITIAHGLGAAPRMVRAEIVCITAEYGYSAGDILHIGSFGDNGNGIAIAVMDATNIHVRLGNAFNQIRMDTLSTFAVSMAKWKLVVRAWL